MVKVTLNQLWSYIKGEYTSSSQDPKLVTIEIIDLEREHPTKFINPTPFIEEP